MSFYRKRVKRIRILTETDNPGEIIEMEAEAKPCETIIFDRITWQKNPDKRRVMLMTMGLNRLELWYYANNPQIFFISLNGEYTRLDREELVNLYNHLKKALAIVDTEKPELKRKHEKNRFQRYYIKNKGANKDGNKKTTSN